MSVNENWKNNECCEEKPEKKNKKCCKKCRKKGNCIKFRIGAERGGVLLSISLTPFMAIAVFLGIACVIFAGKKDCCCEKCCKE